MQKHEVQWECWQSLNKKKNICFYSALMVYCIKTYQFIKKKWINIFFIFPSFIYLISLAQTAFFFPEEKETKIHQLLGLSPKPKTVFRNPKNKSFAAFDNKQ